MEYIIFQILHIYMNIDIYEICHAILSAIIRGRGYYLYFMQRHRTDKNSFLANMASKRRIGSIR